MTELSAETDVVEARGVARDLRAGDLGDAAWADARPARIARLWSGEDAPPARHAEARLLWTADALLVRFVCRQEEPLVVSSAPQLERKTLELWERDVCEMFLTPERGPVRHYAEFEVAPTGEWLDLTVAVGPKELEKNWEYASGMTAAALVGKGSLTLAMRVPWKAFARAPRAGERWRCNLFRCVGRGPSRGYLAWQPTYTPEPAFHVPEKFGWMAFK